MCALAGAHHVGRVILLSVGLPEETIVTRYGIAQFAIDDYLLRLVHHESVYQGVSELSEMPYEKAFNKLVEIVRLMKDNGVPIKHTKRLMHFFRAITGFRAAPATFASRLIEVGLTVLGPPEVRNMFLPLIDHVEEASRQLTSGPGCLP